jgi:hypothetical protein
MEQGQMISVVEGARYDVSGVPANGFAEVELGTVPSAGYKSMPIVARIEDVTVGGGQVLAVEAANAWPSDRSQVLYLQGNRTSLTVTLTLNAVSQKTTGGSDPAVGPAPRVTLKATQPGSGSMTFQFRISVAVILFPL